MQWLANQQAGLMNAARTLKVNLLLATTANELSYEVLKHLYDEFLAMASMCEGHQGPLQGGKR